VVSWFFSASTLFKMLWGIVLSFIATGVVADSISLFNPDPGAPISAYEAGVGSPIRCVAQQLKQSSRREK
jgi:hypothetical protein